MCRIAVFASFASLSFTARATARGKPEEDVSPAERPASDGALSVALVVGATTPYVEPDRQTPHPGHAGQAFVPVRLEVAWAREYDEIGGFSQASLVFTRRPLDADGVDVRVGGLLHHFLAEEAARSRFWVGGSFGYEHLTLRRELENGVVVSLDLGLDVRAGERFWIGACASGAVMAGVHASSWSGGSMVYEPSAAVGLRGRWR